MRPAQTEITAPRDPGKQTRVQSGVPVYPVLDGLRWLAVLLVIAYHVWGASGFTAFRGTPLVGLLKSSLASFDLLFILSGFVMFLPAAARDGELGSLRGYAVRRAARIIPAYWLCLALVIAFRPLLTGGHQGHFSGFGGAAILAHLSLLQTETLMFPALLTKVPVGLGVDGAVWTLSVEACFYLALPFVARAFYRRPVAWLAVAVVVSMWVRLEADPLTTGWLQLIGDPVTPTSVSAISNGLMLQFPCYLGDFAIGMFGAWAVVRLQRRPLGRWQPAAAGATALAALAFLAVYVSARGGGPLATTRFHRDAVVETLVPLALGALVLGLTLAPPPVQRPLSNRLLVRLAESSYGTYLYHLPLLALAYFTLKLSHAPGTGSYLVMLVYTVATACLAGWLSYVALEVPLRRRAQRIARRLAPPRLDPDERASSSGSRPAAESSTSFRFFL